MLPLVPDLVSVFAPCLALGCVSGLASYFSVRALCRMTSDWKTPLWGIYWLICVVTLAFYSPWVVILFLLSLPFCFTGAIAETKITSQSGDWEEHAFFLVGASLLSINLSIYAAVFLVQSIVRQGTTWDTYYPLPLCAVILSALATPSVVPIFVWMLQASKLRPGVDRTFESGDVKSPTNNRPSQL